MLNCKIIDLRYRLKHFLILKVVLRLNQFFDFAENILFSTRQVETYHNLRIKIIKDKNYQGLYIAYL